MPNVGRSANDALSGAPAEHSGNTQETLGEYSVKTEGQAQVTKRYYIAAYLDLQAASWHKRNNVAPSVIHSQHRECVNGLLYPELYGPDWEGCVGGCRRGRKARIWVRGRSAPQVREGATGGGGRGGKQLRGLLRREIESKEYNGDLKYGV